MTQSDDVVHFFSQDGIKAFIFNELFERKNTLILNRNFLNSFVGGYWRFFLWKFPSVFFLFESKINE